MTEFAHPAHESVDELLISIVERLENKDFELPLLPKVGSQMLEVLADPEADASKLTKLIQQDPILTARIFQTSNSAAYAPTRRIESLQQAVNWLGMNHVAGVALALSLQSGTFQVGGYTREVQELWRHMLATGFYAKAITRLMGKHSDMAFLEGSLHAIGKPFVVHTVNQYQQDWTSPIPWDSMLTLIKESYEEVGRQLAEAWGFPETVREAIILHKDHAFHLGTSPTQAASITNLAQHLASRFVDSQSISDEALRPLPVVHALNLQEGVMDTLLEMNHDIQAQVEALLN